MWVRPTAIGHFLHDQPEPDPREVRVFLRSQTRSKLSELRGLCEADASALRIDPKILGDAFTQLERTLERALAEDK